FLLPGLILHRGVLYTPVLHRRGYNWRESIQKARAALEAEREAEQKALKVAIPTPAFTDDLIRVITLSLDEDNPELHPTHQALTRLTEASVNLIFLYRVGQQTCLDPAGTQPVDPDRLPTLEQTRSLLLNGVTIAHGGCVGHYAPLPCPPGWRDS